MFGMGQSIETYNLKLSNKSGVEGELFDSFEQWAYSILFLVSLTHFYTTLFSWRSN